MKKSIAIGAAIAATIVLGAASCDTDATVVDSNMDKAAENFEVPRRVVFMNGITDEYMLEIVGMCNITDEGNQVEVLCKDDPDSNQYRRHLLGLSDNVTYFAEQIDSVGVDPYRYRVTVKPEQIIPDFDLRTSLTS
jgi:hypothetical protein